MANAGENQGKKRGHHSSIFWHAVVGRKTPDSATSAQEIVDTLQSWAPTDEKELDALLELSKRSLDEVTRLTEYEDGKANRILTAMAFLSALVGVLFARFLDKYPIVLLNGPWASFLPLICVYVLFFFYILSLILGVILIVYAVKPRFNVPADWGKGTGKPASFLFFRQIIQVKPDAWAKAFSDRKVDILKREYIQNSILETYLIAEKVRDKLAYLEPGVNWLWRSTRVLVIWVLAYAFAVAVVPAATENDRLVRRLDAVETQLKNSDPRFQSIDHRLTDQNRNTDEFRRRVEKIDVDHTARLDNLAARVEQVHVALDSQRGIHTPAKKVKNQKVGINRHTRTSRRGTGAQ